MRSETSGGGSTTKSGPGTDGSGPSSSISLSAGDTATATEGPTPPGTTGDPGPTTSESAEGSTGSTSTGGEDSSSDDGESSSSTAAFEPVRIAMFGTERLSADLRSEGGEATARESADALCEASLDANYGELECTRVHAFLTIDAGDQILDMPENYDVPEDLPIEGPTGTSIEVSFGALLDGDIQIDLSDAVVFEDVASGWDFWAGSNSAGGVRPNGTCEGWTNSDTPPTTIGTTGNPAYSDFQWLEWGFGACDETRPLLCICW